MRLLSDSGSTKTAWQITEGDTLVKQFLTSGLNPSVMGIDRFAELLRAELPPEIDGLEITDVEFYGAGCTADMEQPVREVLAALCPVAVRITVGSDLLGAARALCDNREGIVAILGTGSNSCLYDGRKIVMNTPALGFILGDEGSGAVLGRLFLNALLKNRLPRAVADAFASETGLTQKVIIEKVYRGEAPNRFLASLAPFIRRQTDKAEVRQMVVDNFRDFFKCNTAQYRRPDLPVSCLGSIAFHFRDCLEEAARAEGVTLGEIRKSPLKDVN